ncbi:MAG: phosphoglucomutase (alpha-D-glucose-1,6-bisphosphate-dependent) [Anaerolineae bacterium]|nr:phosphoglucomutase (alpha-D-glucose-1,6-bisphosphate-dependent) [Anaerolineae bacterium]
MSISALAGKKAPQELLENVPRLVSRYYASHPSPVEQAERVAFGTSGHRGTSLTCSFNEDHVLATAQAVCQIRRADGITGPLYLGMDTHALSEPALYTAIEVFAANGVDIMVQCGSDRHDFGYTPTPAVSHAILAHNRGSQDRRQMGRADGVVITPSHNPPSDGGFKYNPPEGGPAGSDTTRRIQDLANEIMSNAMKGVRRMALEKALVAETTHYHDYVHPYVADLANVIDMKVIAAAGLKIGVDPLGGATVGFWAPIAEEYGLDLEMVNPVVDPTFAFMTVDHDGKIRMDCSSPYAMTSLIALRDRFDVAFGSDPDGDRHGIVTPSVGLMNPNHYLAVAIWYLFQNRPAWGQDVAVGKTLVSSSVIDRVVASLGRMLCEVPVGFKYFAPGLYAGSLGFGGEESAGASFLRRDGTVWTTDKDGILLSLLAAEITARTERDPGEIYQTLEERFGRSAYARIDAVANPEQKQILAHLSPGMVEARELAGDPITAKLTRAPCNDAPIGGLKLVTDHGWFAARPSGTEDIYKIYAESFQGPDHLLRIQEEAQAIVAAALALKDTGTPKDTGRATR